MHKIRHVVTAALSAALLMATGCSGGPEAKKDADGNVELTIQHITTSDSVPLYLGIEQGFFADEGLNVKVEIAKRLRHHPERHQRRIAHRLRQRDFRPRRDR